jgi:DNA-binding MarR family transcriptional regulator
LLTRMEAAELVSRSVDGRTKFLRLTSRGTRLYRRLVPAQEGLVRRMFSCLSRREQAMLLDLLRKLERGMRLARQKAPSGPAEEHEV